MKDMMVYGLETTKKMLHAMVDELKPQEWEFQPVPGSNCAAWIVGHLAFVDRRALGRLEATDLPEVPVGFEERFAFTRTKAGEQKGYGDPKELTKLFDLHRDKLIEEVRKASPELMTKPIDPPNPRFSRIDELLTFMSIHSALHIGHLSTIRRGLGYAPLM